MYRVKITHHDNVNITEYSKHFFFFGAIFKVLRHKAKNCPYSTIAWIVKKNPYSIQADNFEYMYTITKSK